jgi:hypothetical protein
MTQFNIGDIVCHSMYNMKPNELLGIIIKVRICRGMGIYYIKWFDTNRVEYNTKTYICHIRRWY